VGNPFRNRRWPFPYNDWVEAAIFRHADAVIANTDSLAAVWRARHPRAAHKVHTIWNGFDPESPLGPAPPSTGPELRVAHLGTLYGGRHPRIFLESLERLLDRGALGPVRVELTGPVEPMAVDACRDVLERMEARGVVEFTPRSVPRDQANDRMARADILLLLDINGTEESIQVPAKLFDYARVDRPMLVFTTRGSPLERILASSSIDHACVWLGHSPEEVDRRVHSFLARGRRPSRANDWFWSTFDGQRQTALLAGLIAGRAQTNVLEPEFFQGGAPGREPDTMVG
jgi:glycosyltransferase involved in cell wall biosynthesis